MRGMYGRRGRSDKRAARELLAREDQRRLLLTHRLLPSGSTRTSLRGSGWLPTAVGRRMIRK